MGIFKRKSPELQEFLAEADEVAARRIRSDSGRTDQEESAASFFEGRARSRRQAAKARKKGE